MKAFLSYSFQDEPFVFLVHKYLRQQPGLETYFYTQDRNAEEWIRQLRDALASCNTFIAFISEKLGKVQAAEMGVANLHPSYKHRMWVKLSEVPDEAASNYIAHLDPVRPRGKDDQGALRCARDIIGLLGLQWVPPDDVPEGYLFDYEKDIIQDHLKRNEKSAGCASASWPAVPECGRDCNIVNPVSVDTIGDYRDRAHAIGVDARAIPDGDRLTFPEAGPRSHLCFPNPAHRHRLRVGVLVSVESPRASTRS